MAKKAKKGVKRLIGLRTKNVKGSKGVNPKDRMGSNKVDLSLIPSPAKVALALAMMEGATKYGPYSWRMEKIRLRTQLAAAERHLDAVKECEDADLNSLISHLGHVMACCSILLDASDQGTLIDDRGINGKGSRSIRAATEFIKKRKTKNWGQ
jgi:hypothetical protein